MCVARPKKVKGTNKLSFAHTIQNLLKEPMKQEEALAKFGSRKKARQQQHTPSGHRTRGQVGTEHAAEWAPNTPAAHARSMVAFT